MKRSLYAAIIAIFLITVAARPCYAGFVTPKNSAVTTVIDLPAAKPAVHEKKVAVISSVKSHIKSIFSFDHKTEIKGKKPAWQSIASICCSSLGFFSTFIGFAAVISAQGLSTLALATILFGVLCGIGGIVLGVMGLRKKKHKLRGFALAGLILGCVDIFILSVVTLFAALLSI